MTSRPSTPRPMATSPPRGSSPGAHSGVSVVATTDLDGVISFISREGAALLGYERERLLGRSLLAFVPAPERPPVRAHLGELPTLPTGRSRAFSLPLVGRRGIRKAGRARARLGHPACRKTPWVLWEITLRDGGAGPAPRTPHPEDPPLHSWRIVVLSPDRCTAEGLAGVLRERHACERVEVAHRLPDALALLEVGRGDLLLADLQGETAEPAGLLRRVRDSVPGVRVVLLGADPGPALHLRLLEQGAAVVLAREAPLAEVGRALDRLARDELHLPPPMAWAAVARLAELAVILRHVVGDVSGLDDLTEREREVLDLLAHELGNREIGERLDIRRSTVKSHVSSILRKLSVDRREGAVRLLTVARGGALDGSVTSLPHGGGEIASGP